MSCPGDKAPNLTLKTIDGQDVALADMWRNGRNALLVFLRHLAWLPCRDHVAQLRSHYDKIQALNTEVVVISFGTGYWARVWLQETQAPFPLLLDQERAAYRAYGLERSLLRSWGLKNLLYYGKAALSRRRLFSLRGDDTGQLGGDFIVDANGILRLTHPSQDPTDRPSMAQLLEVLRETS